MNRTTITKHLEGQGKSANAPVTFADLMQLSDAAAAGQDAPQDRANGSGQASGQGQGQDAPQGGGQ